MKKITLIFICVITLGLAGCSSEQYSHDAEGLPEKAQNTISQYFDSAISLVKKDKETFSGTEYNVVLTNGCEITFEGNGDWKNIETPNNLAVPSALIPPTIAEFVKSHHAGAAIVGIEIIKKGYEVELSNGVEIQFNKDGGFIQYDK